MPLHPPRPPGLPAPHAQPLLASPPRRTALLATLVAVAGGLSACSTPLPAIQWVRLPAEGPEPIAAAAAPAGAAPSVWQLVAPVALPGHLDRDALLLPQGAAGLQPLGGARWAEPLRDAVPRLLRADLSRALGSTVWAAPLPPGVHPTRQLRVEFSALDVTPDGRGVSLQSRWSMADASGARAPRVGEAALVTAASGTDANALAAAHRLALQQLAQRIAAWVAAGPP